MVKSILKLINNNTNQGFDEIDGEVIYSSIGS